MRPYLLIKYQGLSHYLNTLDKWKSQLMLFRQSQAR